MSRSRVGRTVSPSMSQPAATDGDELVAQTSVREKAPKRFQCYFEARWIQHAWMLPPKYAELTSAPMFALGHEGSSGKGDAPSVPKRLSVSLILKAVWGRTLALRMMALRVGYDTPALL